MTNKPEGPFDPFFNARKRAEETRRLSAGKRAVFEAKMAEAQTRMEEQRAFHERRLAEAQTRMEERRAFHERRMAEAQTRMEEQRAFHERRLAEMAARLAETSGGMPPSPKPFRRKRPPKDEGGEPVPAISRPKPKPLTGGAAAPLDPDRRKPAGGASRKGARRVRLPSDAESRQGL